MLKLSGASGIGRKVKLGSCGALLNEVWLILTDVSAVCWDLEGEDGLDTRSEIETVEDDELDHGRSWWYSGFTAKHFTDDALEIGLWPPGLACSLFAKARGFIRLETETFSK